MKTGIQSATANQEADDRKQRVPELAPPAPAPKEAALSTPWPTEEADATQRRRKEVPDGQR